MARQFARANLPRSPVLAWYGDGFVEFIATNTACRWFRRNWQR